MTPGDEDLDLVARNDSIWLTLGVGWKVFDRVTQ